MTITDGITVRVPQEQAMYRYILITTTNGVCKHRARALSAPVSNQRHPWQVNYLIALILLGVSSCAFDLRQTSGWSYRQPPNPGALAVVPDGGVWCDTAEKAIFMATTGFFTQGCSSSRLIPGSYKVIEVEHIAQNDVRSWVVKISDSGNRYLWIPLPDHNWA